MATNFITPKIQELLKSFRQVNSWISIQVGDPREIICQTIQSQNTTCAILGSRGRNALSR
jgi:nucleotide-binding universal stress UspA family protein